MNPNVKMTANGKMDLDVQRLAPRRQSSPFFQGQPDHAGRSTNDTNKGMDTSLASKNESGSINIGLNKTKAQDIGGKGVPAKRYSLFGSLFSKAQTVFGTRDGTSRNVSGLDTNATAQGQSTLAANSGNDTAQRQQPLSLNITAGNHSLVAETVRKGMYMSYAGSRRVR